jgi:hypothetical protein
MSHKQVSIKLTEEQKRLIKTNTGHDIHELWLEDERGRPVLRPSPGLQSEMEEGGRIEQRERQNLGSSARSGR